MKKLVLLSLVSLMSVSSFAADSFKCYRTAKSYPDFGDHFTAVLSSRTIRLVGIRDIRVSGTLDPKYRPRPQNAGSLRYLARVDSQGSGTGCDHAQIMLNKSMASGRNGLLTIAYDCDSDGTGPLFYVFSCQR